MPIKKISLSELESDPRKALNECCDSGETLVVEMLDHRLVAIQSLEPDKDDCLINELLESNPGFRALLERSKASPRKPFPGTHRKK